MSNSIFKVLAAAWGQSLSAANMAKKMIWYMKENNFLLGEGKNSTAALRPAAVVPAPPWWICTRIQIPLSLCYNQSCWKRVATSCSTNRSNEVCKRFWALQASMSAHLLSWNNCRLWKQDNVCVAICFEKRVVEEDWPQQHIEGIASRGGSQWRDTQSQGLQALHIHKIRESRNKTIQKSLRRRFLLTLIGLWSDNLTESLHPCFTFRIVFKVKVEFFYGWES